MSTHQIRLETIQSMLAAGHRSVYLERHTLLVWGMVGGLLCAFTDQIISRERFPDGGEQAIALLLWLAFWLGSAAALDLHLTRRARQSRSETLPFAQSQLTRAWWMLLVMGTLGSFAMHFHGGGGMVYALWTVLLGLGIYLFGLFSRRLTEWIGLATMILGVAGLASGLAYVETRWLAACCFGIGLPLAGFLGERVSDDHVPLRLMALLLWLAIVTGTGLLVAEALAGTAVPDSPPVSYQARGIELGESVIALPAGTVVPFYVDFDSPLVGIASKDGLPMTLSLPMEIALRDGKPDGRYRIAGGQWQKICDGMLRLRIHGIAPQMEEGLPVVRAKASLLGKTQDGVGP